MRDMKISAGCAVAWGLWAVSVVTFAVAWPLGIEGLSRLSLMLCGAAVTATIRTYFVNQNRMMRNAFELGRDSVSMPLADVRSMR